MVSSIDMLDIGHSYLAVPLSIGGIVNASVFATHLGTLRGFPRSYNVAYFFPGAGVNLYSLGTFAAQGGSYTSKNMSLSLFCAGESLLCKVQ